MKRGDYRSARILPRWSVYQWIRPIFIRQHCGRFESEEALMNSQGNLGGHGRGPDRFQSFGITDENLRGAQTNSSVGICRAEADRQPGALGGKARRLAGP